MGSLYFQQFLSSLLDYETPKIVHIKSKVVGLLSRIVQLVVISYILIWVLIIKKGYQQTEIGITGITTKVTGVTYSDIPSTPSHRSSVAGTRVWDAVDLVVPAQENKAFFVTTNLAITQNQTQSICPEDRSVAAAQCKSDADCNPINKPYLLGHGVTNGTCHMASNTCFVKAWCPLEKDIPANETHRVLRSVRDFTVLVKSYVSFPAFRVGRTSVPDEDQEHLKTCVYDPDSAPLCPVFKLGDIINEALAKVTTPTSFDDVVNEGAVIAIRILFNCDLDYNIKYCTPKYSFDRLDKGEDSLIARGYNYRYVHNYWDGGIAHRQSIQAYGILFIFTIDAEAGKFDIIPTFLNIGSGLALLGIATAVCDFIMLYIHKNKHFYKEHKYHVVDSDDVYSRRADYYDLDSPLGLNDDL